MKKSKCISTTTGKLMPVLLGAKALGSGNHPNSRKNLKAAKRKQSKEIFSVASWEDFYGGEDMYTPPYGPLDD